MRTHYLTILRDTERRAKIALRTQNLENGSPYHGAFSQPDGVYQAKYAIYQVASLIAVYVNKESVYYHDPVVLITLVALITIGGLGFFVWEEMARLHKFRKFSV